MIGVGALQAAGFGRWGRPRDLDLNRVVLLLHGQGAPGASVITDNSRYARSPSSVGGTTTSSAQARFGATSLLFTTGATQNLQYSDASEFDLTGDVTFETFFYSTSAGVNRFLMGQADAALSLASLGFYLEHLSTGRLEGSMYKTGPVANIGQITGTTTLAINTWNYGAYRRSGSNFALFSGQTLGGPVTTEGTATNASAGQNPTANLGVGRFGAYDTSKMGGYQAEVRITIGAGRAINFVPPWPFPHI